MHFCFSDGENFKAVRCLDSLGDGLMDLVCFADKNISFLLFYIDDCKILSLSSGDLNLINILVIILSYAYFRCALILFQVSTRRRTVGF